MTPKQRRRGQPPKGPNGERVSKYPPLTVRIPPDTKDQLEALSAIRARTLWDLVNEAILGLIKSLPSGDRRLVMEMAAKRASARPERSSRL